MGVEKKKKKDSNSPANTRRCTRTTGRARSDLFRTRTGEAVPILFSHGCKQLSPHTGSVRACACARAYVYGNAVGPQSLLTVFGNTPHVSTPCCSSVQDFSIPLLNSLPSSHSFVSLSAPALVSYSSCTAPPLRPLHFSFLNLYPIKWGWGWRGGRQKHSQYKSICADGF